MWMSKRLKLYFPDRCPSTWGGTPPPSETLWWRAVNRTPMTSLRSASRGWWRTPSEWWGWCRWIFIGGVETLQTRHCHYHFHLHFRLHRHWRRDHQSVIVLFYLMHSNCCFSFCIFPFWWVLLLLLLLSSSSLLQSDSSSQFDTNIAVDWILKTNALRFLLLLFLLFFLCVLVLVLVLLLLLLLLLRSIRRLCWWNVT